MRLRTVAWLAAAITSGGVFAAPESVYQPLAAIRVAAEGAVRDQLDKSVQDVELEAVALDARLRLTPCSTRLAASTTPPRGTQARVQVRVSCATPAFWSVNVPVDLRRRTDVLVLRHAVARGESVGAADVSIQSRVLPGLASPYARLQDLTGRVTRRPLPEGAAITAEAFTPAFVVHRGQNVVLAVNTSGIEVRAPGIAMADAIPQQRVRVQNLNSLKIVEGVADTAGVVRVNP